MLMRRSMLDDIGLFDEAYWMYMEDLDLCYRARTAGWITWYEPDVSVMHVKGGDVHRKTSPRLNAAFYRSMRRFVRIHPAVVPHRGVRAAVVAGLYVFEGAAVGPAGNPVVVLTAQMACAGMRRSTENERVYQTMDMSSTYHVVGEK